MSRTQLGLLFALSSLLVACQGSGTAVRESLGISDSSSGQSQPNPVLAQSSSAAPCAGRSARGCTVFTVSKGERVFFGGNDDYINPDSTYWVDPGGAKAYGAIWIGTPDNVQQGVNEKGLAYDANGLPRVDTDPHSERKPVSGGYTSYPIHILHECATVEEVIEWVNTHRWHSYMHDQMQFADATGDAVIISAGTDGELVFTRKPPGDGFLVSTNFNVANPSNGYGYPCRRYDTATEILGQLVGREGELAVQDATNVLDAVHTDGGTSWTLESLVADLPNGVVYLYYFYQFDRPVVLNVADEIANPRPPGPLSRLFPEQVQQEAARRYLRAQEEQGRCQQIGIAWLSLVLASLVLLVVSSIRKRRGLVFWLPVVIILGPLGLLVWLVAGRRQTPGPWQAALVEATGDVAPSVVAFMIMLAVILCIPAAQSSQLVQLLFILVLPLLIGWLFFHGPLLALAGRQGYLRTLGQRLLPAWVAANLGFGGINALAVPLVNWISRTCSLMPMSPWVVVSLWTMTVTGALVALVPLLLYEGWAVRRGFRAWSILAESYGGLTSPSWRKHWWWILLGFAALFGGVVASAVIQRL